MPRAHDDNWDLASSVGATATMVAAGRALATKDPRGLINDPFAEPLVRAVGLDFFTKLIDGELDIATTGNLSPGRAQAMIDGIAVRTKYFDDYFRTATDGGVRQVVILAAGLDARAYRLPWPAGTVVYEIDQPQVIDFKTTTLAGIGAKPTAIRRTVYIDLRADWPAALQAAGLDSTAPTAWLAEGMLIYLPPDPRTGCSTTAPNSVLRAARSLPNLSRALWISTQAGYEKWRIRFHGVDIDMASLVYSGERSHVVDYLRAKGWDVEGTVRTDLFRRNGLPVPAPHDDDPLGEIIFISGRLNG